MTSRSGGGKKAAAAIDRALADERQAASLAMQEATLDDLVELGGDEARAGIDALLAVAAPDDAARIRAHLGLPKPAGHPRQTTDELSEDWASGGYPYKYRMLRKDYERQKFQLQTELLKLQSWVKEERQRIIILFEGRDAAGKGGAIKRFMEHLNPRGARVVALEKPSEVERGQWYFQRYAEHLPTTDRRAHV